MYSSLTFHQSTIAFGLGPDTQLLIQEFAPGSPWQVKPIQDLVGQNFYVIAWNGKSFCKDKAEGVRCLGPIQQKITSLTLSNNERIHVAGRQNFPVGRAGRDVVEPLTRVGYPTCKAQFLKTGNQLFGIQEGLSLTSPDSSLGRSKLHPVGISKLKEHSVREPVMAYTLTVPEWANVLTAHGVLVCCYG